MPMPSQREYDMNGYMYIDRNPISRAGVFPYLGSSLGEDIIKEQSLDPEKVYMVLRPPEQLADPEFLKSCRLQPWIDDHVMLGSEEDGFTPAEQKGISGTLGEKIEFDAEDGILYSNLKLWSEAHKGVIDNGKDQLSYGYRCQYEWQPGEYKGEKYDLIQVNLRGNHLASVDDGRMGPSVAVLDHNDTKGTSAMDELIKLMAAVMEKLQEMKDAAPTDPAKVVVEDGGDTPPGDDTPPATPAKDGDDTPPATPAKDGDDTPPATPAKDGDDTPPATPAKDGDDTPPAVTVEAMDAAVNSRVLAQFQAIRLGQTLAAQLKPHVGVFDHSNKTEAEIAAYGIKKLGLTVAKGQEIPTLKGYLAGKGDPSKEPTVRNGMVDAQDSADKTPSLMDKKLADRSKA